MEKESEREGRSGRFIHYTLHSKGKTGWLGGEEPKIISRDGYFILCQMNMFQLQREKIFLGQKDVELDIIVCMRKLPTIANFVASWRIQRTL